jgi:hypothetical protein
VKIARNKREHTTGRVVVIGGICHFLDPKHYGSFHLYPRVILTRSQILPAVRFSYKLVKKTPKQRVQSFQISKAYGLDGVGSHGEDISVP